jgi:hypothetical protein
LYLIWFGNNFRFCYLDGLRPWPRSAYGALIRQFTTATTATTAETAATTEPAAAAKPARSTFPPFPQ